jgi:DNA-binding NtrC family response regulator
MGSRVDDHLRGWGMARILLVDDDHDVLRMMQIFLVSEGHDVRTTQRGDEAIRLVREGGIDLVMSDVNMAPVDGFEVLQRVRALQADIPVIMLSGNNDPDAIDRAAELGALTFLVKPPSFAVMTESVNRALGGVQQA